MQINWIFTVALYAVVATSHAGTLSNGSWAPANCNSKPEPPVIVDSNVEGFNKSVAHINDWQAKTKSYFECLIKEANADNTVIAEAANKAQAEHRATVEKIAAQADAAKKKLDGK